MRNFLLVSLISFVSHNTLLKADDNGFKIFDGISYSGQMRPRFEYSEYKDQGTDPGKAIVNRANLAMNVDKVFSLDWMKSYLELRSVNNFGYTNYSTLLRPNNYGLIEDSQQARLASAYVDFVFANTGSFKIGRQILNFDEGRIIGARDWRQMGQQFDNLNLSYNYAEKYFAALSYVFGQTGPTTQNVARDTSSVLLNLKAKFFKPFELSFYTYLLGNLRTAVDLSGTSLDEIDQIYLGSDTFGLEFKGVFDFNDAINLKYALEGALQKTASLQYGGIDKDDQGELDTNYYRIMLEFMAYGFGIEFDYASLGAAGSDSDRDGFNTPFANFQRWQGFADAFVRTTSGAGNLGLNKNGLNDMKFKLFYTHNVFGTLNLAYHMFSSQKDYEKVGDATSTTKDLGSEFDFEYALTIPKLSNVDLLVKGAFYNGSDAENYSSDITKFWIGLDYKFAN